MRMNKALRISIIFIMIGVSLSTGALLRSNGTQKMYSFEGIYLTEKWSVWTFNFTASPIDMRIELRSTNNLNIYLLTHEEYVDYIKKDVYSAILQAKNVSRGLFFVKLLTRGLYHLVLERIQNINATAKVSIYTYGIERDLIDYSVVSFVLGTIVASVSIFRNRVWITFSHKNKKDTVS